MTNKRLQANTGDFNIGGTVYVTSGGSVGIGTTTTTYKLQLEGNVAGTNLSAIFIQNAGVNGWGANIDFADKYSLDGGGTRCRINSACPGANSGQMNFLTQRSGTLTTAMTILNDGKVGIGTNNPATLLEVKDGALSLYHANASSTAGYPIVHYTNTTGSTKASIGQYGILQQTLNTRDGYFLVELSEGGNPTERFRIKADGKVGIGTTNPPAPLTLAGAATYISIWASGTNDSPGISFNAGNTLTSPTYSATLAFYQGQCNLNGVYGKTSSGGTTVYCNSSSYLGTSTSIRESKINITDLTDVNPIYQTKIVTFNYRKRDNNNNYTEEAEDFLEVGAVAEDVEQIDPNFVFYEGDKLKGIRYERYVPYLVKAIQELSAKVDMQALEIEALKK